MVDSTQWCADLSWEGATLGVLKSPVAPDPQQLAQVAPLLAWALAQRRDTAQAEERFNEVQSMASRALDLSELVTWLLHARDDREVERLGSSAIAALLKVDDGALLLHEPNGWVLRCPSRELSWALNDWSQTRFGPLLTRELTELDVVLEPRGDHIDQMLCSWGYTHAHAVPLDSGAGTHGMLLALSKAAHTLDAEERVTATQLAIMISVALERLGHQRRLAEHRKSLEDALRLASMGTWELALHNLEVTWSRELHSLYGGPFEALTQSIDESTAIMETDDRFIQERHLRDLLATGTTMAWQSQINALDGRKIWTRTLAELVRDADGVPVRVRGVTRDVTVEVSSQLERERALRRATRYEQLFSMSDTLAAVCGADGVIEEASPSWTRQLGYERHEIVGVNITGLIHPDDAVAAARVLTERIERGQAAGAVSRVRARDGQWRWVSWTAAIDDGRFYCAATDVTELQETSQRLLNSQEHLRQAGAMAHIGAWSFDVTTQTITWSDEVKRIYEVPLDFVPHLGVVDEFYTPEDAVTLRRHITASLEFGTPYDLELEVITATGRRRWCRHQATAEMRDGRATRTYGALQDVTDQYVAREAALAASRVKSQFLANTSHEIRTPLNGILGMTKLALETSLSVEQREYLEAVAISGENLLAIVNDILDISKIESGHLELEQLPFALHTAIFEAARNQASRAHARGLELLVDFDPLLAEQYRGDSVRVGQIVTNLVGNAVKFTERGTVSVRVRNSANGLHLVVEDTGIGIPADRIDAIFEAFTQADGSTNRRFGGTGLGLTITLELVKAMGGMIHVDSKPGRGSTFHVSLPLEPIAGPPALVAAPTQLRALVVSAHPGARRSTATMLSQLGYEVSAADARVAIRILLETPPHLLVVDQELESTRGTEFGEAMMQEETLREIPRILLTRTTSRPISQELKDSGFGRALTRPVSINELRAAIAHLDPSLRERPAPQRTRTRPLRQLKVLLAEDNAINARLALRLVERLGHQVVHVTDGALAIDAVAKEPFDVVLMDMQMPVLDGLEATRRIRQREAGEKHQRLPIIALTANAMKGDDQICIDAGMDAYLTKPLDFDRLSSLLDALAGGTPSQPGIRGMSA
ncbi:MAG: response regulator [Archangium sp.]|nr:response regulator [Archangium sp.]